MLVPPEVERTTERAAEAGELPPGPLHFQELPWYSEYQGNVLEGREPKRWVWRLYLVALASREPRQLDLQRMWVLDGRSRSVSRVDVRWLAPPDTPASNLRLRITRDGVVTVDTLQSIPSWEAVVQRYLDGQRAPSLIEVQRYEAGLDPLGGAATDAAAIAAAGRDSSSGSEDGSIDLAETPVGERTPRPPRAPALPPPPCLPSAAAAAAARTHLSCHSLHRPCPPPRPDEEALLGDADEENLRDFVEEWGDEDEDAFDADLSG